MRRDSSYDAGYNACWNGKDPGDSPYDRGTQEDRNWREGNEDAWDDYKKERDA